ncbi:D-sedoheptulose-7-phosphate isomerase [Pseudozobellia thermophila]|uniref:D-sedoheptulose 7-phosphate isomerase n=1 Tax=Pseudozobellia thermophila TaxID=192903 RepID=A0A1M6I3Z5_9FLAO|nr:SIS domain-containing protein [Pseudozobellia thermophila]SHJ29191.1 D-sedoheptulose 7-phosphate isomerase [Pseudozobellia thermophila]
MSIEKTIENVVQRYPELKSCSGAIKNAGEALIECYRNRGKLLVCGNGGSASDSDHIVGELMKSFSKKRPVGDAVKGKLQETSGERGAVLASQLERGLPAISLNAHGGLISAIANDIGGDFVFAQQVLGYGQKNDVLLAISTSGNSVNVLDACITAKALGIKVIGLLGETGGKIKGFCDVPVCVPATNTAEVQEFHLPVYHALCIMVEETFF